MTRSELVDAVVQRSKLSKKDAADAVEAVTGIIQEELEGGGEVNFSGFGKFHVAERGARRGKHPGTGETIQIAAARVPRFSPGSGLKAAVKG